MDDDSADALPTPEHDSEASETGSNGLGEIDKLRGEYQYRLVLANLRTEAVRAGIIDLDGLKLIDLSSVKLGQDDRIIGGRRLMDDLRRNKPWLFGIPSSSSSAVAPTSRPIRQKSAMEMSDEEYAAARTAVLRYQF